MNGLPFPASLKLMSLHLWFILFVQYSLIKVCGGEKCKEKLMWLKGNWRDYELECTKGKDIM